MFPSNNGLLVYSSIMFNKICIILHMIFHREHVQQLCIPITYKSSTSPLLFTMKNFTNFWCSHTWLPQITLIYPTIILAYYVCIVNLANCSDIYCGPLSATFCSDTTPVLPLQYFSSQWTLSYVHRILFLWVSLWRTYVCTCMFNSVQLLYVRI